MNVIFHRNFRKQCGKIPAKIRRQFNERLRIFAKDPFDPILNNHPLTGDRADEWSINITGDWRAIYLHAGNKAVIFLEIGTHGALYE